MSIVIVAAMAAAVVAAPPPPVKAQAQVKNLALVPVEELQEMQPPPNAEILAIVKRPVAVAPVPQGPDLVVLAPTFVNPLAAGTLRGFPTPMPG